MQNVCGQSLKIIMAVWSATYFLATVVVFFGAVFSAVQTWEEEVFEEDVSDRSPRFFPLFFGPSVIRIANTECKGENGLVGTCYGRNECDSAGGKASGTCSKGFGRCCVLQKTCGMSTSSNCTYFASPGYPAPYLGGDVCTMTVWPCGDSVCQLRLDFIDFNLATPDGNGTCLNDFFLVSGGASNVPRICGINTGEHVYVDFAGKAPISLTVDTNKVLAFDRKWLIKITQVKCCHRAPVGCLMHYTATSGMVKSFNYSPVLMGGQQYNGLTGSRELSGLNYGVCVEMMPGYCAIEWSQNPSDPNSFTVSGDNFAANGFSITGAKCTNDFIVIPNPMQNGVPIANDRFCGTALPTVTTSSKPFVLTVVTDATEGNNTLSRPDIDNRGFCLNYRQLPCSA